ncbi:MAG: type III-B CRISPR module-associated protein Cmr5 [Thermodesulfobacteriota bacterium]|nr:MAG: type III-B CRISPR module-associated protein Cmr5 [Thermodesulfobacteriota bacterium]
MMKTTEQKRAYFCLEKINDFLKNHPDKEDRKKFRTNSMRLAQFIVSNGLIPTLAFYKAKKEREEVYNILNNWFIQNNLVSQNALEELINSDVNILRLATVEALSLANWLKRIVEVKIEED